MTWQAGPPSLWLFVLLELAEELVQSALVLPGHVVLPEVGDVEQQVHGQSSRSALTPVMPYFSEQ